MVPSGWLLPVLLIVARVATGFVPAPRRGEESLRSALNAVARRQRSLDTDTQEYYELRRSLDYPGNYRRKFDREQPRGQEIDGEDEETEFLPVFENGQLETVGDNYQDSSNKLLEKALMDYLENTPEQIEAAPTSLFRERERSSSRKRAGDFERTSFDSEEPRNSFFEERRGGIIFNDASEDSGYPESLQPLNGGPMSWSELLSKQDSPARERGDNNESDNEGDDVEGDELIGRNQDQSLFYLLPTERRNVNGRYPIGREVRYYNSLIKRYPIAKRSPKPLQTKKQITDPKVAQDLGALFGTQSSVETNRTHDHDHTHDDDHHHNHDHDHHHDNDHDHKHDHNHSHEHTDKDHKDDEQDRNHDKNDRDKKQEHEHGSTPEVQKVTPPSTGQKENITKEKIAKPKGKSIEVRKKSIDWSQYFGIDRRKKKATFMARQGTQNQDDEWMLQRYYENMAENLEPNEPEKDNNERKDKFDQLDSKLKKIKDLVVKEAMRYTDGSEDTADMQKVKDEVMTRMATAYNLEKMRKALNELRNSFAAQKEAYQKVSNASPNNATSNYRGSEETGRSSSKRNSIILNEEDDTEDSRSGLIIYDARCRFGLLNWDSHVKEKLVEACVMLQTCRACNEGGNEEECLADFMLEANELCEWEGRTIDPVLEPRCILEARLLGRRKYKIPVNFHCRKKDFCLRAYADRRSHRRRYPYDI